MTEPEREIRRRLEAIVERALAMLDAIDGDCDLEDGGDAEPWLGWARGSGGSNINDDREEDEADPLVVSVFDGSGHARGRNLLARVRRGRPDLRIVRG